MDKAILITGVAGSGKSTLCDELNKLGYKTFGIEDIEGLFQMIDKKTGKALKAWDNDNLELVKDLGWVCNKKKLQRLMLKNSKGIVFYCGIASNLDDLLPLFDRVFLLKASQKLIRERLTTRTNNDYGRTPEIQKWIFGWKKQWENRMIDKGAIVINAGLPLGEKAKIIIERSNFSK